MKTHTALLLTLTLATLSATSALAHENHDSHAASTPAKPGATGATASPSAVAAAVTDEGLVVTVSDNGIGMSPEQIPKALEPFGQIDSKISRRYEGTGLGLPLTKHLVELHGGKLTIESQLNAGTTVKVMLPRERLVQRPARTAATA